MQQNLNQEGDAALSPVSWANEGEDSDQEGPDCGADMPHLPEQLPRRKQPKSRLERADIEPHDVDAMTTQIGAFFDENGGSEDESDDNAFGPYLREGLGDLDIPQGVTVVIGGTTYVDDLLQDAVARPGGDVMDYVRDTRRLRAEWACNGCAKNWKIWRFAF